VVISAASITTTTSSSGSGGKGKGKDKDDEDDRESIQTAAAPPVTAAVSRRAHSYGLLSYPLFTLY
jgi:hypothetical protein